MNRPRFLSLALVALPLLSACAEPSDDDPVQQVERLVDQEVTELTSQRDIICDCWDDWGFESRTNCHNELLVIGPAQIRCIKDAYAQEPEVAIDFLECIVPLEREYTTCIDQRLECADYSSDEPCYDDYSVGRDGCIGLPPTITRDLDACFE